MGLQQQPDTPDNRILLICIFILLIGFASFFSLLRLFPFAQDSFLNGYIEFSSIFQDVSYCEPQYYLLSLLLRAPLDPRPSAKKRSEFDATDARSKTPQMHLRMHVCLCVHISLCRKGSSSSKSRTIESQRQPWLHYRESAGSNGQTRITDDSTSSTMANGQLFEKGIRRILGTLNQQSESPCFSWEVGMVRTLCRELLAELCRPGAATTSDGEGGDLCEIRLGVEVPQRLCVVIVRIECAGLLAICGHTHTYTHTHTDRHRQTQTDRETERLHPNAPKAKPLKSPSAHRRLRCPVPLCRGFGRKGLGRRSGLELE